MARNKKRILIALLAVLLCAIVLYAYVTYGGISYDSTVASTIHTTDASKESDVLGASATTTPSSEIPVTHIATPATVKGIYLSDWVAGSSKYRDPLIKLADTTEINAMVVDVKDSTGRIGFAVNDPELAKYGSFEKRIGGDVRTLTNMLHQKNIYIIGRIAVFQDPYMTQAKPEWAITKKSDGTVWKDHKGLSFLDPAKKEVWDYIVRIAHEAYADGFDEINFDYIRYPSDGDIKDINYHLAEGQTRADNIEKFFTYLHDEVKKDNNIPMSADLFGLTTEVNDDMGIGQVWEKALPHFDFLAPMVYPSHYPAGHAGYKNPAQYPYEVIARAMQGAIKKTNAVPGQTLAKIRPWLQDFNLGATYTADMVKAQMKAAYDNGITSWTLWDPNNKYTPGALALDNAQ